MRYIRIVGIVCVFAMVVRAEDVKQKDVILHLAADNVTKVTDGGKLVKDDTAPGGAFIKLPAHGKAWAVQWFFDSKLNPDLNYMVRIQMKADKKDSEGSSVGCGIYSVAKKITPLKTIIDVKELSDKEYRWINCGNVNGQDAVSAYFYLAQLPESAADNVYVSAIEFIPEGVPGYKKNVREPPIKLSATPASVKIGDVVNMEVPAARQVSYPDKKIMDDGTIVSSLSPKSNYWSTKWHIFNHLAPGVYNARALLKIKGAHDGHGIRFGIYCPKIKKESFSKIIPATQLAVSDKYQWLNLGQITIIDDNQSYLFVTGFGDNSFDQLFIKKIEFTRIK